VTLFALDGRPHLQAFALAPPDLRAYAALKAGVQVDPPSRSSGLKDGYASAAF
jgi:hypothetical protein